MSQRVLSGRHVLCIMLVFFGVTIAVNLGMAVVASRSWTGLLTDNVYVESQRYDSVIAHNRRTRDAGLDVTASYAAEGVTFALASASANARITGARGERPVGEADDRDIALTQVAAKRWQTADPLPAGAWNVVLSVDDDGGRHELRRRITVPAPGAR